MNKAHEYDKNGSARTIISLPAPMAAQIDEVDAMLTCGGRAAACRHLMLLGLQTVQAALSSFRSSIANQELAAGLPDLMREAFSEEMKAVNEASEPMPDVVRKGGRKRSGA